MEWNMNTDFQKMFDLILRVAVEGKLKPEEMITRVFVFSDMEFDEASYPSNGWDRPSSSDWQTDYEVIVSKYREKGYGESVPEIVFWNLRDLRSTPVLGNKKGVALVSGFSKNLIKVFLEHDGEIDPMMIMEAVICRDEYKSLVVVD